MVWVTAAMMGLSILSGMGQSKAARAQARAQATVTRAETAANEVIREASNVREGARASLGEFIRSMNNQRIMEAAGAQYNQLGETVVRTLDQAVKGGLSRQVAAMEEVGAMAAQAAWAGVGGTTVDLIDGTLRLRNAMIEQDVARQEGYMSYDMVMQQAGIMEAGIQNLDYSQMTAAINSQQPIAPYIHQPSVGNSVWNSLIRAAPAIVGSYVNWRDAQPAPQVSGPVVLNGINSSRAGKGPLDGITL